MRTQARRRPGRLGLAITSRSLIIGAVLLTAGAGVNALPSALHHAHAEDHRHVLPRDIAALPSDPQLSDEHWTVTADSAQTPAGNVLDENSTTAWTSANTPSAHRIVIDMKTQNRVSGLHYQPQPGANRLSYRVHINAQQPTEADPGTLVASGTFAASPGKKVVPFPETVGRYVVFVATTDNGGGDASARIAELDFVGLGPPGSFDRTGWTARADSVETRLAGYHANNVVDGDLATMWHSAYFNPAPWPHWIEVDMQSSKQVTGLAYRPRPGGGNGTVGGYQIYVGDNPAAFGPPVASGTWADNGDEKVVSFPQKTGRYVRLTATTEAGNRGPWSTAAEINVMGVASAPNPKAAGSWGPTIGFPLVPVAAAHLPNNKLLTWAAGKALDSEPQATGMTQTATMDLTTGVVSAHEVLDNQHDMFCPGTAALPDGRIMISGGSNAEKTTFYNPATNQWTPGPNMTISRGYQSSVTLSDGRVFLIGGSWSGGKGGKHSEVWSQANGWQQLPGVKVDSILTNDSEGVYRADNHPWLFAASNGRVFHAGPSKKMHWFDTNGMGSVTAAGVRGTDTDAMNGTAVMYDVGKVLTTGGAPSYWHTYATKNAHVIDINGNPTVTPVAPMAHPRVMHNSVVLPDGKVLVMGGSSYASPYSDTTSIMPAELWNPATNTFTTMATAAVPRNYHSVGTLLPDGRVFSGGGGLCGSCLTNHPDAQIFTPPYLYKADGTLAPRPVITNAPATTTAGASVNVTTGSAVTSFSLVRMGPVTHSINTDQRRIPLTPVSAAGNTYTLAVPGDRGVVVPGQYMLFALDANGVPSVAAMMKIS